MSIDMTWRTSSTDSEDTETLGAQIGSRLRGGEVIELVSDLGGGKTTLVRGLARGAGSSDHVASPTFTISREYRTSSLTLHHFDFYRLHEAGIMADELHELLHDPHAVVLVEWSDVVQHVLPAKRLTIRISHTGDEERHVTLSYPKELEYLVQD